MMNIHEQHKNRDHDGKDAPPVSARSERGAALLMVLILSTIALAVMTALIYMITVGTQITGMEKRYRTAREAASGGWELMRQFVATRGTETAKNSLKAELDAHNITTQFTPDAGCSVTVGTIIYSRLAAKLQTKSSLWPAACSPDFVINKDAATSYDLSMVLGSAIKFNVYAKIVDAVQGNTTEVYAGASGTESVMDRRGEGGFGRNAGSGVVFSGSGSVALQVKPYLYTVAVDAENAANPSERAKLSIVYQY